jgi:hypothetical protein
MANNPGNPNTFNSIYTGKCWRQIGWAVWAEAGSTLRSKAWG